MDYTEILTQLRRMVRSVNLESKRIEKEYGVSIPQLLCLKYLSKRPERKASQREIGEFLSLNASTITGIVNRLERKDLILKLPKGEDKRVNFVTLTEAGEKLIANSPELIDDRVSRKLKALPEARLQELRLVFDQLIDLLDIPEQPGWIFSEDDPSNNHDTGSQKNTGL